MPTPDDKKPLDPSRDEEETAANIANTVKSSNTKSPGSEKGSVKSKDSRPSSKNSRRSSAVMAKQAALLIEAAALEEKEEIERQMLQLQQKSKRLELKIAIDKLQAEQEVLEEADGEEEEAESNDREQENIQERVKSWVEAQQSTPGQWPENEEVQEGAGLDPLAPEFHPDAVPSTSQHVMTTGVMEEMIHALHMPKTEMMTFEGEPIKFWTFIKAFDNNIGRYNIDEHAKLARLLQYCKGRAYKVIEGCAAMNQGGYMRARELLHERFGDKYAISTSWVNRITSRAKVTNESLQEFADELLSFRETLCAVGCLSEVNQQVLVQVAERLPVYLQHRWKRQAVKIRERAANPGIDDLVQFTQSAAREVNDPTFGDLGAPHKTKYTNQPHATTKRGFHGATTTGSGSTQNVRMCVACHSSECQSLFRCEDFKKMSPEKRLQMAKSNRLCFSCLRGGHSAQECRVESTCTAKGCRIKHTKFLHINQPQRAASETAANSHSTADASDGTKSKGAICTYVRSSAPRVALPVVKVRVTGKSRYSAETYALLDNGSTNTFCSTSLLKKISSYGQKGSLSLSTLESRGSKMETSVHELEISDVQGHNKVMAYQAYAVSSIPVSADCVVKLEDLKRWDHLKNIEFPELLGGDEVEMLIGQDCPEILIPLEVRSSERRDGDSAPYATRTLFGWTVNGPLGGTYWRSATSANFISTTLERQVEEFWKIEGAQLSNSDKGLSLEDRRALGIMQSVRKEDGHYSIPIPFREERTLPNNKVLAERRLACLAKKLEKNLTLKQAYDDSMEALIQKGYAEKVLGDTPVKKGAEWYIPHHPVINPNKSKIRVVFDCAARYEGVALNDKVMQGPDLTNGLLGILLRFRQFPVAISADVEAMFHQVKVPEEDRDVLRYLWWPNGDSRLEPEIHRMTVHLFGGTWSPSVCTYALQQTARDNTQDFEPEVVDTVLRNFYVDDCLKSFQTEARAVKMVTDLPSLLARGGFRLCKWLCNRKQVLQAIPESERAAGLQDLNLQALPVERTLGVLWDVNSDVFTYAAKPTNRPMTRRGLLGAVCSVYDPMGFVTPFTIRGKWLVQDLAREKVSWDEPLGKQHLKSWQEWLKELEVIPEVKIERCLQPQEFGDISKVELHHFSDGSTAAYGSASYVRLVNTKGQVRCHLLFTRSRVTPLKQMTIPRLELAAAALSVQQDEMMQRELSLPIDCSFFWTDSIIVLAYIRNEKKRFHTYVANRLAVIHAGSSAGQWRHISSEFNPADDITRGLSMRDLIHRHRWFQGPEFLSEQTVQQETEPPIVSIDDDPEVKRPPTACSTNIKNDVMCDLVQRYSSWTRLKRATAWLLRYGEYLLAKARKQEMTHFERSLDVEELQRAERAIVRYVQGREYAKEIRSLQDRNTSVQKASRLYKLEPLLSAEGILVCGGRSKGRQAGDNPAQPLILPKDHPVTYLLVKHYHEMYGHSGREYLVAMMRQRYWIPGIRTAVRRYLSQCRHCRRLFSSPSIQRMADLPKERLATDQPPFTNVGVDCFGPFTVKLGRRESKRYGCIFTCLTSRAVHIEVLDSMGTSSFINALHRFISRRGNPQTICSDNGTNFVGTEKELHDSMEQWNQRIINKFLSQREIQWRFNPPGASHMGGAWERLIRSIRRILSAVMSQQTASDDALSTMLCLVEGIFNSRPLTMVSDDPMDLEPLTPNHLLLLRPMLQLPPGVFNSKDCYVRRRWRQVHYLADVFWRRWLREYLPLIQFRTKWRERKSNLSIGDVVLIVDYNTPRNQWLIGRVTNVSVSADGLVRSAQVRTKTSTLTRPVTKLCYLEGQN